MMAYALSAESGGGSWCRNRAFSPYPARVYGNIDASIEIIIAIRPESILMSILAASFHYN